VTETTTKATRANPPQQPPPVQRLELRYRKVGRARFASHRDVARALERALRRAGVPMAYSSGFSPHPRISYAGASATGAATEADYLELALAERRDPAWVRDALSAALPEGIDIAEAVERPEGGVPLTRRLTASLWRSDVAGPSAEVVSSAVDAFWSADDVVVERRVKDGVRTFDARGPALSLTVDAVGALVLALRHDTPLVRPDDVIEALRRVEPRFVLSRPALHTRLAQGPWGDDGIVDPFEI